MPKQEWVHMFVHTLDTVPRNRHTKLELWRGTAGWESMTTKFKNNFNFEDECLTMDAILKAIKNKIFEKIPISTIQHVRLGCDISTGTGMLQYHWRLGGWRSKGPTYIGVRR